MVSVNTGSQLSSDAKADIRDVVKQIIYSDHGIDMLAETYERYGDELVDEYIESIFEEKIKSEQED